MGQAGCSGSAPKEKDEKTGRKSIWRDSGWTLHKQENEHESTKLRSTSRDQQDKLTDTHKSTYSVSLNDGKTENLGCEDKAS